MNATRLDDCLHLLQRQYSKRIYGRANQLDRRIRVVWRRFVTNISFVLSPYASNATDFHRPKGALLSDMLWVKRPDTRPVPSHSYIEVFHRPKPRSDPFGSLGPLWAYVAPGSGVFVRVGRVLHMNESLYSLSDFHWLVWRMHQAANLKNCTNTALNFSSAFRSRHNANPSPEIQKAYRDVEKQGYDTIQRLHRDDKRESNPLYNELIFLAACETDSLLALRPRCGAKKRLRRCSRRSMERFKPSRGFKGHSQPLRISVRKRNKRLATAHDRLHENASNHERRRPDAARVARNSSGAIGVARPRR